VAYSYKVGGKLVALEVDPSVVAVKFKNIQSSQKAQVAEAFGVGPLTQRIDIPSEGLSIIPAQQLATDFGVAGPSSAEKAEMLRSSPDVEHASAVFRVGANQAVATDRIVIGVEDAGLADRLLVDYGLTETMRTPDRVVARVPANADVFALANTIDEVPGVQYAEPDFVVVGKHIPKRADGPFPLVPTTVTAQQYATAITQADKAWQIVCGDPSVIVAVLDEGVDTSHPDLHMHVVATYDALDNDSYQEPNPWDGHGTACSGLAMADAATPAGVRGLGWGCSLMAIRIARSNAPNGPWQTTPNTMGLAIDWAWEHGASVLSNSWTAGVPTNIIAYAFERARTRGRNGRGCVIVVAAGNNNGPVTFPANLAGVLAVSASNEYDQAKTPDSADGETWWGSCFGPEVAIAAPGVHNLTTDIVGSGGYAPGNYAPTFNGTSSATPIVAGACALVLSKQPQLTEAQVRQIIIDSADKVGQFPYVAGRNDRMGHGRLNVLRAVQLV
jgi:thermitase